MPSLSYIQGTTGTQVRKADNGDFSTWRAITMPAAGDWRYVSSNSQLMVVAAAHNKTDPAAAVSWDGGETWEMANNLGLSAGFTVWSLRRLGPRWVIVDGGGNSSIFVSGNGVDWAKYAYVSGSANIPACNAQAYRLSTDTSVIMTANGALTQMWFQRAQGVAWSGVWTRIFGATAGVVNEMHVIADKFVAVGTRVFYSADDGVTWNSDGTNYGFGFSALTPDGSKILAIKSVSPFQILESTDGVNWSNTGNTAIYQPVVNYGRQKYVFTDIDGLVALLNAPGSIPSNLPVTVDEGANWSTYSGSNWEQSIALVDSDAEAIVGDPTDEDGVTEIPGPDLGTEWEICVQASAECPVECSPITLPTDGVMAITDGTGESEIGAVAGDYVLSVQPFGCETPYLEEMTLS